VIGVGCAALAVACVDMSAPKGAASISTLQLPQPAVVLGDTLRDTTGAIAPLDVVAYDAAGSPISGQTPRFFITDSLRRGHLTADTRFVIGDSIGILHVVGQVGPLQTPVVNVQVTYAPATLKKLGSDSTLVAPLGADSSSSIGRVVLPVSLLAANDSASQGFIVHYSLIRAPATRTDKKSPAVFIADNSGGLATADTTTPSGASRRLTVISAFLADAQLLSGAKTDTAIVEARVVYKGALVSGAPVRWIVPIRVGLK
jgi:hypothetical protein